MVHVLTDAPPRRRGRPRKPDAGRPHQRRAPVAPEHPHHVTVRVRKGTWNLRSQRCFKRIRRAFNKANERDHFRVVHYAVLGDHLHLIVEANDRRAMSNGVRALLISMARRLNRLMDQRGSRYRDRFHERALTTPSAVRTALRYVLTNAEKHYGHEGIDPYSSGPWFPHWVDGVQRPRWTPCRAPPTAPPQSQLLCGGWRSAGQLIAPRHSP
jgi:REP element-mobilizing transposase RayT